MINPLQFDLLVGVLALQGLIADVLLAFGAGYLIWLWISDRRTTRKRKQMEAREDEELKQILFAQIDVMFQDGHRGGGDGTPAYL